MIKANELRVGNFILYEGKYRRVHGVSYHPDALKLNLYADKYDLENAYPIALTPEILEKCGFDKLRRLYLTSQWYDYPKDNKPKLTAITDDEFEISRSGLGSFHPQCKYLHQLQNLYFALTGEELKVNL